MPSSLAPPAVASGFAASAPEGGQAGARVERAVLTSLALRALRRTMAFNAFLLCALLPEASTLAVSAMILLCLAELVVPATRFCREAAFQDAIALICYLTLPIFLFIYAMTGSANPMLDGLLSFLLLFHLKWVYAPRGDFHWLANLLLFALVGMRTSDWRFGLCLLVFLVLSLMYLAGQQELSHRDATAGGWIGTARLRRAMIRSSLVWLPVIAVITAVLFYIFPRFPPTSGGGGSRKYTGVTDSVDLGNQGPLGLDPKIVALLEVLEGEPDPASFYLRTGHLDAILEENWSFYRMDHGYQESPRISRESWAVPEMQGGAVFYQQYRPWLRRSSQGRPIKYRMTVRDPEAHFLALLYGSYEVELERGGDLAALGSDFYEFRGLAAPFTLQARALQPASNGPLGWTAFPHLRNGSIRHFERRYLTALPGSLSSRELGDLARSWTRQVTEPRLMAARVAATLRREYRYSLDPMIPPSSGNPVRDFLLDPRYGEGYCEMFAAAMVVMLRHLDIPARIAVGFANLQPEPIGGKVYAVRRSNAHAWVEAWIDGEGWVAFDPTPDQVFVSYQNREGFKVLKEYSDGMQMGWRDLVVNYDHVRQGSLASDFAARFKSGWSRVGDIVQEWEAPTFLPRGSRWSLPGGWVLLPIGGLAAAVVLIATLRRRALRRMPPATRARVLWRRIEHAARRGGRRLPSETPRAFLGRLVELGRLPAPLAVEAARVYESASMGETPSPTQGALLRNLRRAARRG